MLEEFETNPDKHEDPRLKRVANLSSYNHLELEGRR